MAVDAEIATPFRPGQRLGRYELLYPLAEGGMAVVWLARMEGTRGFEKTVAIKLIRQQFGDDERFERMFLDEATIASKIHHPNVVQTLDLGEEHGVLYLVMEWIEGESLAHWRRMLRKRGRDIPLRIVVRIIADVCAALHAAHELRGEDGRLLGLVHRDVSPQNVLVAYSGAVKVIDFGIAKARNRAATETREGVIKGKVPYMAPEQVRAHALDRRVDVWATGVCLYELLAGKLPYDGDTHADVIKSISAGAPFDPLPAGVPKPVAAIVDRALDPDPGRRFETAAAMQRALEEALVEIAAVATAEDTARLLEEVLGEHIGERRRRVVEGMRTARASLAAASGASDQAVTAIAAAPVVTLASSDLQTVDTSTAVSRATSASQFERVTTVRSRGRTSRVALLAGAVVALGALGVAATMALRKETPKETPSTSPAAGDRASSAGPSASVSPPSTTLQSEPHASTTAPSTSTGMKPAGKPSAKVVPAAPSAAASAKRLSPAGNDYGF